MSCDNFSSSTVSLKVSFLVFVVVFALHITGFCFPRWSNLKMTMDLESFDGINYDFYAGLWKDCHCATFRGTSACICQSKHQTPGSFTAVQALETVGLIGLVISGIITFVVLFTRQDKTIKFINTGIALGSGVLIVTGVIVYAVNCNDDYDTLFSYVAEVLNSKTGFDTAKLTTSFILCTIAGSLCIIGFAPLLFVDICTAPARGQAERQLQSMPAQYQGQMPPVTGQVVISTAVQQPTYYSNPPAYAPPFQPEKQYPPANHFNRI